MGRSFYWVLHYNRYPGLTAFTGGDSVLFCFNRLLLINNVLWKLAHKTTADIVINHRAWPMWMSNVFVGSMVVTMIV